VPASPTAVASPHTYPATPTLTATPALTGTTRLQTNIRSGPAAGYTLLASLAPGLPIKLTGRNADKSWCRLNSRSAPTGAAGFGFQRKCWSGRQCRCLPIAGAPPLPTAVRRVTTATAAPDYIPVFRADKRNSPQANAPRYAGTWKTSRLCSSTAALGTTRSSGMTRSSFARTTPTFIPCAFVNKDKSERRFAVTVKVAECGGAPIIGRFEASDTEIHVGDKVTSSGLCLVLRLCTSKKAQVSANLLAAMMKPNFNPVKRRLSD